jgi:plastocyanin
MRQWRQTMALIGASIVVAISGLTFSPAQAKTIRPHVAQIGTTQTWNLWVGAETSDHAIQAAAFLPGQVWIHVGDTVIWTSWTTDIHTVTFLKPGQMRPQFNPTDATQSRPVGSHDYDGQSYHNSGLLSDMAGMTRSYSLRFTVPGTFGYLCLVHALMYGVVHVLPMGAPLPFTQADYDRQIAYGEQHFFNEGLGLIQRTEQEPYQPLVWVGVGSRDGASVMRFIRSTLYIRQGTTVTFVNGDPQMVHTVTFGTAASNIARPYGNPAAFDGVAPLNSGYLGAYGGNGSVFRVTFTRAGTFTYRCMLHYTMGMTGTIVVLASGTPTY